MFEVEYTSRISVGDNAEILFRGSTTDVSLVIDMAIADLNLSDYVISGEIITMGRTTLDLGFDIKKDFIIIGEFIVTLKNATNEEYVGGHLQIIGSMFSSKNVVEGTIETYGDALKEEGGIETCTIISENTTFTKKIATKSSGNITVSANLDVAVTTPNITLETLTLSLDNGKTYNISLASYSANFTVESAMSIKQIGKERRYSFEPINIVIWVVPRNTCLLYTSPSPRDRG